MTITTCNILSFIALKLIFSCVNSNQFLSQNTLNNKYYSVIENRNADRDSCALEEVEIIDSTLLFLVEQIVENDKQCPYYDDKNNFISINIYGVKDSMGNTAHSEYKIQFSIWNKSVMLFGTKHDGFKYYCFKFRNINGIIRARVTPPVNWFKKTGQTTVFSYSNDLTFMDDDSHSLYEYWFVNQNFYTGDHYDCK